MSKIGASTYAFPVPPCREDFILIIPEGFENLETAFASAMVGNKRFREMVYKSVCIYAEDLLDRSEKLKNNG